MTTSNLLAARAALKAKANQPKVAPKVEYIQTAEQLSTMSHIEKAKQMIAQHSDKAHRLAMAFDALTIEEKALVLIAAGVNPQLCGNEFKSFDSQDRKKICNGVKMLDSVTRKFQAKMGAIKFISDSTIN